MIFYLESGTLDLGFRIWGLGSVTWNSGFGSEDLELRICELDRGIVGDLALTLGPLTSPARQSLGTVVAPPSQHF